MHSFAHKTNGKKLPTASCPGIQRTQLLPILLVLGLFSCNYRFCLLPELLPGFGRRLTYKISASLTKMTIQYLLFLDAGGGFGSISASRATSQDAAKVGNILSLYAEQHNFLIGQSCCQVFTPAKTRQTEKTFVLSFG